MSVLAVFVTVAMSVATALLLEWATHLSDTLSATVVLIGVAVMAINAAKFWLWGWIHRRYDLSKTYPVGTLFFPLIYAIALWRGEAVLEASKLAGIALIVGGIVLLQRKAPGGAP